MQLIISLIAGILFGLGMIISGMFNPYKVLNFFDILGSFDASMIFVMGGALLTTLIGFQIAKKRGKTLTGGVFHLPTKVDIDKNLVIGAAIFGFGWGIIGFCPGSALPLVGAGNVKVIIFIASFITGGYLVRLMNKARAR